MSPRHNPTELSITQRFGKRLSTLRRKAGWSQQQMSDHVGMNRSFISDMERGARIPSIATAEVIALAFGITMSQLFKDI